MEEKGSTCFHTSKRATTSRIYHCHVGIWIDVKTSLNIFHCENTMECLDFLPYTPPHVLKRPCIMVHLECSFERLKNSHIYRLHGMATMQGEHQQMQPHGTSSLHNINCHIGAVPIHDEEVRKKRMRQCYGFLELKWSDQCMLGTNMLSSMLCLTLLLLHLAHIIECSFS